MHCPLMISIQCLGEYQKKNSFFPQLSSCQEVRPSPEAPLNIPPWVPSAWDWISCPSHSYKRGSWNVVMQPVVSAPMACWSPKVCSVGDAGERKKIPLIKNIWAVVEDCVGGWSIQFQTQSAFRGKVGYPGRSGPQVGKFWIWVHSCKYWSGDHSLERLQRNTKIPKEGEMREGWMKNK